jgi:ABC-2 type transport system permease protein
VSAARPPLAGAGWALRAEWTKLRSTPGPAWLLVGFVVATVGTGAATDATVRCPPGGCGTGPVKVALTGVALGQAIVAVLAVLSVSGEHSTGLIRTTLVAIPHRVTVLATKAVVLAGVVAAAAAIAVPGCLLAGRLVLPAHGFAAANGHPPLSPGDGEVLRAAAGTVAYLVLIALLSLGVAAAVRDPAAAIGVVLGLLYLFPLTTLAVTNPHWQRHLQQLAPMTAGFGVQATTGVSRPFTGPWAGLGVLAAWAAAALLAGGLLLHRRDA